MRLRVRAVGKSRGGPEIDLAEDYARRIGGAGRSVGFTAFQLEDIDAARRGDVDVRRAQEGEALTAPLAKGGII
ncbi:MAG: 23S rRNA (pseudouridine(1915)-N(3))-methyltransferase RlmH, partial [Pseudomonadota bacterium]